LIKIDDAEVKDLINFTSLSDRTFLAVSLSKRPKADVTHYFSRPALKIIVV